MPTDAYIQRRNESLRQARQFLLDLLTEGPQPYQVIHARAQEASISLYTLMTVKCRLNIQSRKSDGHMVWQLRNTA
jgi:hypothetical protein